MATATKKTSGKFHILMILPIGVAALLLAQVYLPQRPAPPSQAKPVQVSSLQTFYVDRFESAVRKTDTKFAQAYLDGLGEGLKADTQAFIDSLIPLTFPGQASVYVYMDEGLADLKDPVLRQKRAYFRAKYVTGLQWQLNDHQTEEQLASQPHFKLEFMGCRADNCPVLVTFPKPLSE